MKVAGSAEHFPVLYAEGPVPGGFDDAGSVGIFEEDGGVIVYFGIDSWFNVMGEGGHGDRGLAVHEPGHEVGAVAAEIADGAAAVQDGVGEPVQEVGAAANLFWALVAVVGDHLPGGADVLGVYHFEDLLVGIVPGGLVIGEHPDMILARELGDAVGVFDGGGERFLDHDGDTEWCADLYYAEVLGDGVVGEDGIGVSMCDQRRQIIKEEGIGKLVGFLVTGDELGVGLCDAGDDDLTVPELVHDVVDMVMGQAGDPDT